MQVLLDTRRTVRHYVNPYDKSTVVSVFPMDIREKKNTIQPSNYHIEAGSPTKPTFLVIGTASWWRDIDPDQPLIEIPQPSMIVAESLVVDYCAGMLGYARDERQPGLFWVPGEFNDVKTLTEKYPNALKNAIDGQRRWYEQLIIEGDSLWARTNGNPVAIPDLFRLAAKELGRDRAWIKDFQNVEMSQCPACGHLINKMFPLCPNCKTVIDTEKVKSLGLQFVK